MPLQVSRNITLITEPNGIHAKILDSKTHYSAKHREQTFFREKTSNRRTRQLIDQNVWRLLVTHFPLTITMIAFKRYLFSLIATKLSHISNTAEGNLLVVLERNNVQWKSDATVHMWVQKDDYGCVPLQYRTWKLKYWSNTTTSDDSMIDSMIAWQHSNR